MVASLSHLAVGRKVSASTQNLAKSALLFLYKQVLAVELPWLDEVIQANAPRHLPVVLTTREVSLLLDQLDGIMVQFLRGMGLRVMEVLRLRDKDLDTGHLPRGLDQQTHPASQAAARGGGPARPGVSRATHKPVAEAVSCR